MMNVEPSRWSYHAMLRNGFACTLPRNAAAWVTSCLMPSSPTTPDE